MTTSAQTPSTLPIGQVVPVKDIKLRSLWGDALRRLLQNKLSVIGLIITTLFLLMAVFGPLVAPYPYQQQNYTKTNQTFSAEHWLGTDDLGRDIFSRILWGARTAFLVATLVTSIALTLGIILGGVGAYFGGWVDWIVGRLIDVTQSIPTIMLAILITASFKKPLNATFAALYKTTGLEWFRGTAMLDLLLTMAAIAFVSWPAYARLIRSQVLSLREQDFIQAAQSVGAPTPRIIFRHIVPNALGPIIVAATFGFSSAMILEASLSYLGLGIQPPAASWGAMINDNLHQWRVRPYLVVIPSVFLGIATIATNFLGDGLNDALNPRAKVNVKK